MYLLIFASNGHRYHSLPFNQVTHFDIIDLGLSIKVVVHKEYDFPTTRLADLRSSVLFSLPKGSII